MSNKRNNTFQDVLNELSKNNGSLFFEYFDDHDDEFEIALDYYVDDSEGWVVYYHKRTSTYLFVDYDNQEVKVVVKVAELSYDIMHDINIDENDTTLDKLFDNVCCGEQVDDDGIKYLWFELE